MGETRGVLIASALIGAAGAINAALIISSVKEPTPVPPGPSPVNSRTEFSVEFSDEYSDDPAAARAAVGVS